MYKLQWYFSCSKPQILKLKQGEQVKLGNHCIKDGVEIMASSMISFLTQC